jgi:predicted dehydrogenase
VDMSVHHMAALRLVAEAAGSGEALSVKASTRNSGTGLAAPDCADATVTWNSGLVSCLSICMVASQVCAGYPARTH